MKRVILGTAGHIDHGKTELVKALSGIDTDRLKEEKQRGISIELGFAYLDLGDAIRMGIVDVPGHEKFVRQMVAGSGGIDIAALVIALDEGVMPQTVEHLDILSLLGIPLGVVVLTKLDLVDQEFALLAEEDAKDLIKGTFLEGAPLVKVSSRTGEGIDELKEVLTNLAARVAVRPVHGLLRLPVDRVFTLKGYGTVLAGTLISGTLSVGDDIEILPRGLKTSVRSLESHNQFEQQAFPGERVAVNLRGIEPSQVRRGDVITHPGEFKPSYIVDVKLSAISRPGGAFKNRKKVKLHHFTSEVEAIVVLPNMDSLEPGQQTLAQIRTASEIVPSSGDRFVIRALSPSLTVGGGVITNPRGTKLKSRTLSSFMESETEDEQSIVSSLVRSSGPAGTTRNELIGLSGLSGKRLDAVVDALKNARRIVRMDASENRLVHIDFVELVRERVLSRLAKFHADNPLKQGISKQELRSVSFGSEKLFKAVLDKLVQGSAIVAEGDLVRASSHQVTLGQAEKDITDRLTTIIVEGRNAPPTVKEILAMTGWEIRQVRSLLKVLEATSEIVRVSEDMYFSKEYVEGIKKDLLRYFEQEKSLTPSKFSEITGSSRKYNIPLLEYLDRERFTIRVGDQRVLRGSGNSGAGGRLA
ncbi:MAG: selenocysteine-specific elongation factor [Thermodesulfobacteriota bacterium]|nr:selenocysteine-specific elongation factor [Thermodesulfobacteriota bacterium]